MKTETVLKILTGLGIMLSTGTAAAQGFPSKPVRLVVPFAAGGAIDTIARTLSQPLNRSFGQSVVVDNRPSTTGVVGAEVVARAPADGHTLLLMGPAFTINPALGVKLPYDTLKDFTGVARLASNPMLIAVHPSMPVGSLKQLVALAHVRPGEITYATTGSASPTHLAMEAFKSMAKINIIHVPYQGGAPAVIAALGGHTSILMANISESLPHVTSGKLRPIAVTTLARSDIVKDVPTVAESGYPGFDMSLWFGAWVRAATPKDAVNRLNAEINRALQLPELTDRLGKLGLSTAPMSPEQFDEFFRAEVQRNAKLVKDVGVKVE